MKRWTIFVPLLLFISACAQTNAGQSCNLPPLKQWTKEQQITLANEIATLPDNFLLIPAFDDYMRMRAQVKVYQ